MVDKATLAPMTMVVRDKQTVREGSQQATGNKLMSSSMMAAVSRHEVAGLGREIMGTSREAGRSQNHGAVIVYDDGEVEQEDWQEVEEEEDEDVIDIDTPVAAAGLKDRWLVVALFYTRQRYSRQQLFKEMSYAWGLQVFAKVRDLDDNRFLIEFHSERELNVVTSRGFWKHLGKALIVVPYDGITQAAEVEFNTIALWVRFFYLPEFMITENFGKSLGGKLGEVLEFGGAFRNFLRVRVAFPLLKPL